VRRPRLEVADVFHRHGAAWRKANAGHVSLGQLKAMSAIESCRSAALGGHVERCEDWGATLWRRGDHEGARAEAEQALLINPNLARGHAVLGMALTYSGRAKEGLTSLYACIRLDPRDTGLAARLHQVAVALYLLYEYEASVETAKRAIRSHPEFPPFYRWLAAALGQLGRADEAKEALAKALAIAPTLLDMHIRERTPRMRQEDHAHLLEGLRMAGWPY